MHVCIYVRIEVYIIYICVCVLMYANVSVIYIYIYIYIILILLILLKSFAHDSIESKSESGKQHDKYFAILAWYAITQALPNRFDFFSLDKR